MPKKSSKIPTPDTGATTPVTDEADTTPAEILIGKRVLVKKFAEKLEVPVTELISVLIRNGFMVNMNQEIDFDTAALIAQEFEKTVKLDNKIDMPFSSRLTARDLKQLTEEKAETTMEKRPPVVIVMGHVDHGKTTLLDAIRETNEASKEAGHITQHIGAYQVVDKGREITFLDTPGHEAFVEMRQKGADITDIAVLVVAANDGVKPTTTEAMNHARAAGIPIIVAINKVDLPDANIEQAKKQLSDIGLIPEEYGGDTVFVEVSAKKRKGIKELEDTILLIADMLELKANQNREAIGYVIESHMSPKGGPVATVIVKTGTLKTGNPVAVGDAYGTLRSMTDYNGVQLTEAKPAMPVQIMGLNKVPLAGDVLQVVESRTKAKELADKIDREEKAFRLRTKIESVQREQAKKFFVIVKSDVQGSTDAILQSIQPLELDGYGIEVVNSGVGAITESDVMLAASTNAWILAFSVSPSANAEKMAEREKVVIKTYDIIYNLIEDVKSRIAEIVGPEHIRNELGKLKVLAIFRTTKSEMIVGGKVTKGFMKNKSKIEIMRGDEKIGDGTITQLQHNKAAVDEVKSGNECGISFHGNAKIKEGDELVAYEIEEKKREFK